jgi:hypothetical protein
MRYQWIILFTTVLLIAVSGIVIAQAMPRLNTVTPDAGKAGAEFTTEGETLEKANVTELYITDGKNDIKVQVVQQEAKTIKFKVPAATKAGRFSLMLLTGGAAPKLLEQPVKVTIEE